ncbi:LapA family protein [Desulfovibrio sp. OttesenSCG-928-C14]|nr:LapA family protein [Desulfovibrio sp. OttesenSCG-928-C14]
MRFLKTFLVLLVMIIVVMFFVQNNEQLTQPITFVFNLHMDGFSWETGPMPAFLVMVIFFVLGFIASTLLFGLDRFKLYSKIFKSNKKIKAMEQELQAFRQRPLAGELKDDNNQVAGELRG